MQATTFVNFLLLMSLFTLMACRGPTNMVTGNGFGLAIASPEKKAIVKLYAHPYRFERSKADLTVDGVLTPNLIEELKWEPRGTEGKNFSIQYQEQSQVIAASDSNSSQVFYMPFGLGLNALVTQWASKPPSATNACLKLSWAKSVKSVNTEQFENRAVRVYHFKGLKEMVVLTPLQRIGGNFRGCLSSNTAWALVVVEDPSQIAGSVHALANWAGSLDGAALLKRELTDFEAWRKPPPPTLQFTSDDERKLWRQNETVLRMAQIRETNTDNRHGNGLILGCLPEGRWFMPWVRDMNYSLHALIALGHLAEAKLGLDGLLNARPVGKWTSYTNGADYQISVTRYFGNGEEEADFSSLSSPNVELDGWGLTLASADEYFRASQDLNWLSSKTYRSTVYETLRDLVAKPLLANLEQYNGAWVVRADSSLWEVHQQNKMHFAYTTITAIHGLTHFRDIALAMNDHDMVAKLDDILPRLQTGFQTLFVSNGALIGTAELGSPNRIDGSVLEAFNFGIIKDPLIINATVTAIQQLKTPIGGYKRTLGQGPYDVQDWVFVDFALARSLLRTGDISTSAAIFQRVVEKTAADHSLIPELYVVRPSSSYPGAIGAPTGAIPMVSWGAAVSITYLLERARIPTF